MKFCPKCGSLMIPRREGDKVVLKCTRCGYEEALKSSTEYYIRERTPTEERTITTLHVSEGRRGLFKSREELEQEREEYREVLQELLQEELEGSEE